MPRHSLYFGGVPTEIELKWLLDTFGVPEENWSVDYEEVAALLKVTPKTPRFRTITNRWRKTIYRDHNVLVVAKNGKFIALDPSGRLSVSKGDIRQGVRKALRGRAKLLATDRDRLTGQEQQEFDHATLLSAAVEGAARLQSKRPMALVPTPAARQAG